MKLHSIFGFCALFCCIQIGAADQSSDLCATAPVAIERASAIRGLRIKTQVPCLAQDKGAVKAFLDETIEQDLPPKKLTMEQLAYRAIGMIPDNFEYGSGLVQFLVSQLGGYYDPKRKRFVMAAWLPAAVQEPVAVHELTHALQDQYYDLGKLLDPKSENSDQSVALSALIEGDATAVMLDNERQLHGMQPIEKDSNIDALILQQVLGASFASQASDVPESLQAMLIFPYTSGLRFVHTLLRKGGYREVGQAYARPPNSTREILHPSEYLVKSFTPNIPQPSEIEGASSDYLPEYLDVVGEFGVSSLLSNGAKTKKLGPTAASGWVGDKLGVFPEKDRKRLVSWKTRWESGGDAREFYDAYRALIEEKYHKAISDSFTELTTDKSIRAVIQGTEVSVQIVVSSGS